LHPLSDCKKGFRGKIPPVLNEGKGGNSMSIGSSLKRRGETNYFFPKKENLMLTKEKEGNIKEKYRHNPSRGGRKRM